MVRKRFPNAPENVLFVQGDLAMSIQAQGVFP